MFFFPNVRLIATIAIIAIVIFNFLCIKHLKSRITSLENKNLQLKAELTQAQLNFDTCQKSYQRLLKKVTIQEAKYRKKIAELLKKAQKPVKVIEVPKIIEKPIYVPSEDCKKMAIMINQFSEVWNNETR